MDKHNAVSSLKESIRLLETKRAAEGEILKKQISATLESLRPVNLIKNSIKELATSVEIKNSLFETIVSILTGYLSKKIMIKTGSNPFLKIIGAMVQLGVTSLVAKNADSIRILISDLFERVIHPAPKEASKAE